MSASGIKTFARQAEQYYQRGVAAARGGQREMAERLLRQAVRLNPHHEQAWLWLSGVLDDPDDIAFCLRAVLDLDPDNERARQGLAWLEQRHGQRDTRRSTLAIGVATTPATDPWWATWRRTQRTWLWTLRTLLLIPIVLLGATLIARELILRQPLPTFVAARELIVAPPAPTAAPVPTSSTPARSDPAAVERYLAAVAVERQRLREATSAYRETTDRGRTTLQRATATQQLRDELAQRYAALAQLQPPPDAAATHRHYLDALRMEIEAFDLLLEYYRTYDTAHANAAALRLQEARAALAQAVSSLDALAAAVATHDAPAGGF
ncbi:hypothetical protein [Kallotenue papyrolyticum]|uniref:hypothetical protein n=1 Tax=Kallotenue papyrolyticum TaxID=1325125 RepID=UPI000492901A|nr:hypothetical protein [Kallotenue papyrolyticum]